MKFKVGDFFKAGDTVMILEDIGMHGCEPGDIVEIEEVENDDCIRIYNGDKQRWAFPEELFKLDL